MIVEILKRSLQKRENRCARWVRMMEILKWSWNLPVTPTMKALELRNLLAKVEMHVNSLHTWQCQAVLFFICASCQYVATMRFNYFVIFGQVLWIDTTFTCIKDRANMNSSMTWLPSWTKTYAHTLGNVQSTVYTL